MPFGKYFGITIDKLPKDYLEWGARTLNKSMQKRFKEQLVG